MDRGPGPGEVSFAPLPRQTWHSRQPWSNTGTAVTSVFCFGVDFGLLDTPSRETGRGIHLRASGPASFSHQSPTLSGARTGCPAGICGTKAVDHWPRCAGPCPRPGGPPPWPCGLQIESTGAWPALSMTCWQVIGGVIDSWVSRALPKASSQTLLAIRAAAPGSEKGACPLDCAQFRTASPVHVRRISARPASQADVAPAIAAWLLTNAIIAFSDLTSSSETCGPCWLPWPLG